MGQNHLPTLGPGVTFAESLVRALGVAVKILALVPVSFSLSPGHLHWGGRASGFRETQFSLDLGIQDNCRFQDVDSQGCLSYCSPKAGKGADLLCPSLK